MQIAVAYSIHPSVHPFAHPSMPDSFTIIIVKMTQYMRTNNPSITHLMGIAVETLCCRMEDVDITLFTLELRILE